MRVLAAAATVLLLLASARAWADDPHTDAAVGARAVLYRANEADRASWGQGVQVKGRLGAAYALQGSLDRARYSAAGSDWRVLPLQISVLGYLTPQEPSSFYLLAGYGWYFSSLSGPAAHHETRTHPHVGAGIEILASGAWSLDASYRFFWNQVWRYNDYKNPLGSNFRGRGTMVTLAVTRRL